MAKADKIQDTLLRHSFLYAIKTHQELLTLYDKYQPHTERLAIG
jgi:hypothetical protein